jgi:hypothetical protein
MLQVINRCFQIMQSARTSLGSYQIGRGGRVFRNVHGSWNCNKFLAGWVLGGRQLARGASLYFFSRSAGQFSTTVNGPALRSSGTNTRNF